MSLRIEPDGIDLKSYLAHPAGGVAGNGLVLCHGFPQASREAASAGLRYAEMADRIAAQAAMTVLTFNFRGTAQSEGDFSLGGWCSDLRAAIAHLRTIGVEKVWLAGFGAGASLCLQIAGSDQSVSGVVSLSARAHFDDWVENWQGLLMHALDFGMIRNPDFPSDPEAWVGEIRAIRPVSAVPKIPPRPLLIIHGADDERVPVSDARELAAAAGGRADLRIIPGAGHRLRHDPRVIALLLGWLDSQRWSP